MTPVQCEFCSSKENVTPCEVPQAPESIDQNTALLCGVCQEQLEAGADINVKHWYCLRESIWSENPVVKVLAWRVLNKLSSETWAQDLLEQLYLEDELLQWAQSENHEKSDSDSSVLTKDSNGATLLAGDSVTLIKDLEVKGANFTAKRGTLVRSINLTGDPALVEGRVNGTLIVLKTCFLKKAT